MKKKTTLVLLALASISLLASCTPASEGEGANPSSEVQAAVTAEDAQASSESSTPQTSADAIAFETTDLEGNPVTSDVFQDYDLTMINVWGTGCVPCIEEMPGLAQFHDNLPANVNMLSVCVDYDTDPTFAEDILTQSKANFATLRISDSMYDSILAKTQALPTTLFVDRDGNLVGDIVQGAPAVESDEQVVEHYMAYVNERLGELGEA